MKKAAMRRKRAGLMLLAAAVLLGGCGRAKEPVVASAPPLPTAITAPAQTLPTVPEEDLVGLSSLNDFALKLFQAGSGEASWVVSPVNVALALGQLRPGAGEQTAAQMDSALGLKEGLSQEQVWASMASLRGRLESLAPESLWQGWSLMMGEGPSVQVQYMELLDQSLGAQVNLVDYEAAQYSEVYSAWVKQASGGLITAINGIPEANAPLVVTAAAALDGKWAKAFNEQNIRNATFELEGGQKVSTAMMTTKATPPLLECGQATFLAMPLDGNLEAWMILPPEGTALKDFVASLTMEQLTDWRSQATATSCLVSVPKIDISSSGDMTDTLRALGLAAPFDEAQADFSAMGNKLSVARLLSAFRIRLGETGVEAADEPMSQRMLRGMDRELKGYTFNRPFVLIVAEKDTGNLVMLAAVTRPSEDRS